MDETVLGNWGVNTEDFYHRHHERFQGSQEYHQTKRHQRNNRGVRQQAEGCQESNVWESWYRTAEEETRNGTCTLQLNCRRTKNAPIR